MDIYVVQPGDTKDGEVIALEDDTWVSQLAQQYGVIPLLLLTTASVQGDVDLETTYEILIDENIQNRLFKNILQIVREKGYSGVNLSAQYINVDMIPHEVHFINATTINSLIQTFYEKGITGTGIWNIMNYFTQIWLVINSQYKITKILPEI